MIDDRTIEPAQPRLEFAQLVSIGVYLDVPAGNGSGTFGKPAQAIQVGSVSTKVEAQAADSKVSQAGDSAVRGRGVELDDPDEARPEGGQGVTDPMGSIALKRTGNYDTTGYSQRCGTQTVFLGGEGRGPVRRRSPHRLRRDDVQMGVDDRKQHKGP